MNTAANDLATLKQRLIEVLRGATDERVCLDLTQASTPFVELGISSLATLRFWNAVEDALGIEWGPADRLTEITTIDALAARLLTRQA